MTEISWYGFYDWLRVEESRLAHNAYYAHDDYFRAYHEGSLSEVRAMKESFWYFIRHLAGE